MFVPFCQSALPRAKYLAILACFLLPVWNTAQTGNAQSESPPADDATKVLPFINETTFLVVKVDPVDVKLPDLGLLMSPQATQAYQQFAKLADNWLQQLRTVVGDRPLYATIGIPISQQRIPIFVFVEQSENPDRLVAYLKTAFKTNAHLHNGFVVATPMHQAEVGEMLKSLPPYTHEGVSDAFEAVKDYPVQALLLPPPQVRRAVEELMPELPRQLGGGPSRVLTEGLVWAAFGLQPAQLRVEVTIQSKDEQAAKSLAAHIPKLLRAAYDASPKDQRPIADPAFAKLLEDLKTQVDGDRIKVAFEGMKGGEQGLGLLAIAASAINQKAQRQTNMNRLKQIMLALHNYHDVYKMFPPAEKFRNEDGKHHLSWRVHILPFVEQTQLYEQFHLDEPWDSPHNKKLLDKMPDVFKSHTWNQAGDAKIKVGYTTFVAPVGEGTILGGDKKSGFRDCLDGTSNTIALVEVKPEFAVPWTAPDDYAFAKDRPAAGLLLGSDGRWLCAFADGSVQVLRGDIKPETVLHLFLRADGEVIDRDEIR
jgi:hypothetical protein